jgi:hypothetical protein
MSAPSQPNIAGDTTRCWTARTERSLTAIFSRRVKTSLKLLTSFLLLGLQLQIPTAARAQTQGSKQHFVCNVGYTPNDCLIAMTAFRKVLARYPAGDLGDWTWVLVRSEDWKRILLERGLNPDSPAFSYLPKRETFFDGSLVVGVSSRGAELSATWQYVHRRPVRSRDSP